MAQIDTKHPGKYPGVTDRTLKTCNEKYIPHLPVKSASTMWRKMY